MSTAEEKAEMLRKQVIAKVHWGASDREVRDWLEEERQITGDEADRLIAIAEREKRKAIRSRAMMMLIFSGVFIAITIGYFFIQWRGGFILYGKPVAVLIGVCGVSVVSFVRSIIRLLTGKAEGPID